MDGLNLKQEELPFRIVAVSFDPGTSIETLWIIAVNQGLESFGVDKCFLETLDNVVAWISATSGFLN